MNIIAFIPARGGSKSVPLKNIKPFCGNPLISWGINSCLRANIFTSIVCSTDSNEIAKVCRSVSPKVTIDVRPSNLALDDSPVSEVVYEYLFRKKITNGLLYLIQPTSPLLRSETICLSANIMQKSKNLNSLQTVTPVQHNNHSINQRKLNDAGEVEFIYEAERAIAYNKQKKRPQYVFGNLIVVNIEKFLQSKDFFVKPSHGLVIPYLDALDIDGPDDFVFGEILVKNLNIL